MNPYTSIVLVGLLDPHQTHRQSLIGIFTMNQGPQGQKPKPLLIYNQVNNTKGSVDNPYVPNFKVRAQGRYVMVFPDYIQNFGLKISLSKQTGEFTYEQGLDPQGVGGSGIISNGGIELVDALDSIFFGE